MPSDKMLTACEPREEEGPEEEIGVYRRADHLCLAAGGDGDPGRGGLPHAGISEQTFYRWQRMFAGMGIAELRRLRQLERRTANSASSWWT
jgi:hypothetical protein